MSLTRYGIRGDLSSSTLVSLLSLLLMPAIVYGLGVAILPPVWLKAAVITAACPAGINAFLLATHFQSGERLAATVILRARNSHYRKVEEIETADTDQDGIPDVFEGEGRDSR